MSMGEIRILRHFRGSGQGFMPSCDDSASIAVLGGFPVKGERVANPAQITR